MCPKLIELLSWNGPTIHVCCFMLARASTETFVSRVQNTAKNSSLDEKFVSRVTRQPRYHSIHVEFVARGTGASGFVGLVVAVFLSRTAARQNTAANVLLTRKPVDRASGLYSPDCHLLGPPQQYVGGRQFHVNEGVEMAVREWLRLQKPHVQSF